MSEVPQPEPQPEPETPIEPTEPAPGSPEEAEADEAESGETPEEPAQPEPETEPPQPEGLTQAELEARYQKVEKAWGLYVKRAGDVWGDDAVKLIPLTISPSAPPGFLSADDAGRIPDEVKAPLLDFLGITQETEYPLDPSKIACTLCRGEGKTRTESKVPDYRVLICRVCGGTGLAPPVGATENGPGVPGLVPVPVGAEPPALPQGDVDGWGIERLLPDGRVNPNFGRTPQYWDTNFPTGHVG